MRKNIVYQWGIELIRNGRIVDTFLYDTRPPPPGKCERDRLETVLFKQTVVEGKIVKSVKATAVEGVLPEKFEDGSTVPQEYRT